MDDNKKAILERYMDGRGLGAFVRWINERECGLKYRSAYNWANDCTRRPHTAVLLAIRATYPAEDPRHKFAVEMMGGNER